jgi:hypothetical protein
MEQKVLTTISNRASAERSRANLREKFNEVLKLREQVRLAHNASEPTHHKPSKVDRLG